MITDLVVFEDGRWRDLAPLTDLTPVPRLAFGASDLAARWERAAKVPLLALESRPGWTAPSLRRVDVVGTGRPIESRSRAGTRHGLHAAAAAQRRRQPVLAVNAAAVPGPWLATERAPGGGAFTCAGRWAARWLTRAAVQPGLGQGEGFGRSSPGHLPLHSLSARIAWPWQLVDWNAAALSDWAHAREGRAAPRGGGLRQFAGCDRVARGTRARCWMRARARSTSRPKRSSSRTRW
jgi:hypothetical protein